MYKNIAIVLLALFAFTACSSKDDVQRDAKCYEVPKTGMCKAMFSKYYFDVNDKKCKIGRASCRERVYAPV